MSQDNAPFYVGQKVVSISDKYPTQCPKGTVVVVTKIIKFPCGCWSIEIGVKLDVVAQYRCVAHNVSVAGSYQRQFHASKFAPYNPYSNSVSKELAEKAMSVGDGADQPIKIKELELTN